MTVVRKKNQRSSQVDLQAALLKLIGLLEGQNEAAAVTDLRAALTQLETSQPDSEAFHKALATIVEAFEGEHELIAYTFRREQDEAWSVAEDLYLASTSVLNLVHRLLPFRP